MESDKNIKTSKETTADERSIANKEGSAFLDSVEYMINKEAKQGELASVGDYYIGYAVEEAEGLHVRKGHDLYGLNRKKRTHTSRLLLLTAILGVFFRIV